MNKTILTFQYFKIIKLIFKSLIITSEALLTCDYIEIES